MKQILVPVACLGLGMIASSAASAASPDYCALYAKEYAKHALATGRESGRPQWVQDRAYYKCLNMDDEPLLPPTAYTEPATTGSVGGPFVEQGRVPAPTVPKTAVNEPATTGGVGGPFIEEGQAAASIAPEAAVKDTAVNETVVKRTAALEAEPPPKPKRTAVPKPAKVQAPRRPSGSGYAMWSDDWKDWCAKHFPRSFNAKTGTVIRNPEKPRLTMCR